MCYLYNGDNDIYATVLLGDLYETINSCEVLSSGLNIIRNQKLVALGFPGGAVVENLPANAGDTGSSPGLGRSHMPQSN